MFKRLTLLAVATATVLGAGVAQAAQQLVPAKSEVRFAFRQMNAPIEGRFRKLSGTVDFDPAKPQAGKADIIVDIASIDLGSPEGETEARGKGFFNVPLFPQARFTAASFKPLGNNRFEVSGKLTIKNISKDIVVPFTIKPEAGGAMTAEGAFPLKRLAFKVGEGDWADTDTVADDVQVKVRLGLAPAK